MRGKQGGILAAQRLNISPSINREEQKKFLSNIANIMIEVPLFYINDGERIQFLVMKMGAEHGEADVTIAASNTFPSWPRELILTKMTSKANGSIQRSEKLKHVEEASPNWVIIVGGALLSTLSIRLCCKLKQAFEVKKSTKTHVSSKGISNSTSGGMYAPISPMSKDGDDYLSMVKVPSAQSSIDNVRPIQGSLLDRFELPLNSINLDSPCISESGSDIYSKREVMQKLQQQIKRRDDMITEMQAQITFLQNSLNVQMAHATHLQAQLDSSYRELFDSEREIKRIQKAIAEHCACNTVSSKRPSDAANGHAEGHHYDSADAGLLCIGFEKSRGEDVIEMLRKSVEEMKEVIKGKDFLIQSYKEQKMELCSKVTELQLRVPSKQVSLPNIL